MRRLIWVIIVAVAVASCGGPRTIPDKKMSLIVRDLLLVNSYHAYNNLGKYNIDTVDFYTPVLEKYGYTNADFKYSLNKMAMRKSSRITDIIDSAVVEIIKEDDFFIGRKNIAARVDTLLSRRYRDTVYVRNEPLKITSLRDRTQMEVTIPAQAGSYDVKYNYLIDSADMNYYHAMRQYFTNSKGSKMYNNTNSLTKYIPSVARAQALSDTSYRKFTVVLCDYATNARQPSMRVDSIVIVHIPPVAELRERFLREIVKSDKIIKPLPDVLTKEDSSALHVVPPYRIDTTRRNNR